MTTTESIPTLRFGAGAARILFSVERAGGGPSVVEITMPEGSMPPLHEHDEDETVFLLEGRMTFFVGADRIEAGPRTKVELPAGVAHTYRVERGGRARWLVVTESADLERFVRAVARPAGEDAPAHPSVTDAVAFTVAAVANGIRILGPSGTLPSGRADAPSPRELTHRYRLAPDRPLVAALG